MFGVRCTLQPNILRWSRISAAYQMRQFSVSKASMLSSPQSPPRTVTDTSTKARKLAHGPGLKEFLVAGKNLPVNQCSSDLDVVPYFDLIDVSGRGRRVFFEVYGCQMNVSDTEIVWSILKSNDYVKVDNVDEADVVLLITCAIREKAESKIWSRLKYLANLKKRRKGEQLQVGVLGCMAERLKTDLLEKERSVDVVAGPDSYKDLPRLLAITKGGQSAVNVLLSLDETYADIVPVRLNHDSVTSFLSIMRGCDNMCTYCIVPFTRGRERSRPINTIENETKGLAEQGIKEITLLGQNVNSYRDLLNDSERIGDTALADGFRTVYKPKKGGIRFAELLARVAEVVPDVRIRFTSPHPKDFPDEVLNVMRKYPNICRNIHLPAQSGNTMVLERMRRGYTREAYLDLVDHIRDMLPGVALSSDFIAGFCGETEEEFADTVSLMEQVKYNVAYVFAYSMRAKTTAHRRLDDDVLKNVKIRRLQDLAQIYRSGAEELNAKCIGQHQLILIEGLSKKSDLEYFGRNDANIKVIIPADRPIAENCASAKRPSNDTTLHNIKPGDFVVAKITESNSQVLKGVPLYHATISDHFAEQENN